MGYLEARKKLLVSGPDAEEFNQGGKRNFGHCLITLEYMLRSSIFLFSDSELLYLMMIFAFALLGLLVTPVFYPFHLLDIATRVPALKKIWEAVVQNGRQLLLTGMLGFIIIYIFAAFGFTFLHDMYYDASINSTIASINGENTCTDLLHCFLSSINYVTEILDFLGLETWWRCW